MKTLRVNAPLKRVRKIYLRFFVSVLMFSLLAVYMTGMNSKKNKQNDVDVTSRDGVSWQERWDAVAEMESEGSTYKQYSYSTSILPPI